MSKDTTIGLVLVTCDRPKFFSQCFEKITNVGKEIDHLVVVNDGKIEIDKRMQYDLIYGDVKHIHHNKNYGVGIAKNNGLRKIFFETDCEHFFVIEDDILITNGDVFRQYINASKQTGIKHFCYGLHGPMNKKNGAPDPRMYVDCGNYYGDKIELALYRHCVGAFCYYHRSVLEKVGFMNEKFKNAWEHCHHTYEIGKVGMCTPFWWIPDIKNSSNYLQEIEFSDKSSIIRRDGNEWKKSVETGLEVFDKLTGHFPLEIPDHTQDQVVNILKKIKKNK